MWLWWVLKAQRLEAKCCPPGRLCLEEKAEQYSSMAAALFQKVHKIWSQPDLCFLAGCSQASLWVSVASSIKFQTVVLGI